MAEGYISGDYGRVSNPTHTGHYGSSDKVNPLLHNDRMLGLSVIAHFYKVIKLFLVGVSGTSLCH